MPGSSNKTYRQRPSRPRPQFSSRVNTVLAPVARSFSEHPVLAAMAGAAAALVFAFLTVESTLRGVTNAILSGYAITIVALAAAATLLSRFAHSEELLNHRKLRKLARTDALTGLANWKSLDAALTAKWGIARRKGVPLSVILVDIDHFKRFNDTLGHEIGDNVLITVANCIAAIVAESGGFVARYGGDEFGVVLGKRSPEKVVGVASTIRRRVQDLQIQTHGTRQGYLTVSVGCATCEPLHMPSADELKEAADLQLNEAKAAGRNCVHAATLSTDAPAPTLEVSP